MFKKRNIGQTNGRGWMNGWMDGWVGPPVADATYLLLWTCVDVYTCSGELVSFAYVSVQNMICEWRRFVTAVGFRAGSDLGLAAIGRVKKQ